MRSEIMHNPVAGAGWWGILWGSGWWGRRQSCPPQLLPSCTLFIGHQDAQLNSIRLSEWVTSIQFISSTLGELESSQPQDNIYLHHTLSMAVGYECTECKDKDGLPEARHEMVEENRNHHPGKLVAWAQTRSAAEGSEQTGPFRVLNLILALHMQWEPWIVLRVCIFYRNCFAYKQLSMPNILLLIVSHI